MISNQVQVLFEAHYTYKVGHLHFSDEQSPFTQFSVSTQSLAYHTISILSPKFLELFLIAKVTTPQFVTHLVFFGTPLGN